MVLSLDPLAIDINSARAAKDAKGFTFSLLIAARGAGAAKTLGEVVALNRSVWMATRGLIDEIGVVVEDDDGGDYDMVRIALDAGATWAVHNRDVAHRHSNGESGEGRGEGGVMRSLALLASGTHLIFHGADIADYNPRTTGLLIAGTCLNDVDLVNGSSRQMDGPEMSRTEVALRTLIRDRLARHVSGIAEVADSLAREFVIKAELFGLLSLPKGGGAVPALKVLATDHVGASRVAQVELPARCQLTDYSSAVERRVHDVNVAVDVLERYFHLRALGIVVNPATLSSDTFLPLACVEEYVPQSPSGRELISAEAEAESEIAISA